MEDKEIKKLVQQFNKLKTDKARYKFIQKYNKIFKVVLDNDCTWASIKKDKLNDDDESIYGNLNCFSNFVGWDEGVFDLFELLGIDAEGC
ncbi:hypothetical protein HGB13_00575 [bacterium]|nr:hypothetical protein [bacterium]